ncbi:MAG: hypothetical protein E7561_03395 [Ruminococcaceae bacterium]|nr:hypothetical protein [Oscillospiraceae bacterium]
MIEQDTIKLLRECDAGIKMGVSSIDDVIEYVADEHFKDLLSGSKDQHIKLKDEIGELLDRYHDDGKEPNPMAKSMSYIKTNVKLALNESDATIADLMTEGYNMGIKSLSKYLNKYKAADEKSKDITKRLINIEERLVRDIREYL